MSPQSAADDTMNVAIVPVNLLDRRVIFSNAEIEKEAFTGERSTSRFYEEASFGKIHVKGTVLAPYTHGQTNADFIKSNPWACGKIGGPDSQFFAGVLEFWLNVVGYGLGAYNRQIFLFPTLDCSSLGGVDYDSKGGTLARGSGANVLLFGFASRGSLAGLFAHELGHSLDLGHAADHLPQAPVGNVGDLSSMMGGMYWGEVDNRSLRHFNAPHKIKLGILGAANVRTVSSSGTFDIANLETPSAGVQALKIAVPGNALYVSYKEPIGFDSALAPFHARKVFVHRFSGGDWNSPTQLVAVLGPSDTYGEGGAEIRVNSVSNGSANVALRFTATPVTSITNPQSFDEIFTRVEDSLPALSDPSNVKSGTLYRRSILVNGRTRTYLLAVPRNYSSTLSHPFLVSYHSMNRVKTAVQGWFMSALGGRADDTNVIVAYPQAANVEVGTIRFPFWNDGLLERLRDQLGIPVGELPEDIAFTRALIADVQSFLRIDSGRIFASGVDLGGSMAYRAGCELSGQVRAIGSVGGVLNYEACAPSYPVSVIQFHGTENDHVLIGGGVGRISQTMGFVFGATPSLRSPAQSLVPFTVADQCSSYSRVTLPDLVKDNTYSERAISSCARGHVDYVATFGGRAEQPGFPSLESLGSASPAGLDGYFPWFQNLSAPGDSSEILDSNAITDFSANDLMIRFFLNP